MDISDERLDEERNINKDVSLVSETLITTQHPFEESSSISDQIDVQQPTNVETQLDDVSNEETNKNKNCVSLASEECTTCNNNKHNPDPSKNDGTATDTSREKSSSSAIRCKLPNKF